MPLAFLLLAAAPLAGQSWRPVGPDGGVAGTLAAAPSQPGVVYLLGRASIDLFPSLYRSADGGQHWQSVAANATVVALLGVDPRNASALYGRLSSNPQELLIRSVDGGMHWAAADHGLEAAEALAPVGAPVLVPGNPARWVIPTTLGLFDSRSGVRWGPRALAGTGIDAFAVDPRNPAHWLAAVEIADPGFCPPQEEPCTHPDVLESGDAGRTWASTGYRNRDAPRQILVDARRTYLLAGGAVVRRRTARSWQPAGPLPLPASQLALAPSGTLYAATGLGVYRSTDGGQSWQPSAAKARPVDSIASLALLPDAAETLLASGFEEIWRSTDGGATWLASSTGLSGNVVESLAVAADSTVYAAPTFDGVEASANGGRTWTRRNRGLGVGLPPFDGNIQSFSIADLATDPNDAATLYAMVSRSATRGFVARTTDHGAGWQLLPPLPTGNAFFFRSLAVSPGSPRHLYAVVTRLDDAETSVTGDVVLHSEDGGTSWREVLADDLAIATVVVDPHSPQTIYAWTFRQGLLKSADGGTSWQATDPHLPGVPSSDSRTLVVDPRSSRTVYAGTVEGVYVSRDGGATFTAMSPGLPAHTSPRRLLLDPLRPERLYLLDQAGVFRWLAGEATWAPLDDGLPSGIFTGDLAIDPVNPDVLYLSTFGRGVYRLDLGASP